MSERLSVEFRQLLSRGREGEVSWINPNPFYYGKKEPIDGIIALVLSGSVQCGFG
jgi:hypothetical protein